LCLRISDVQAAEPNTSVPAVPTERVLTNERRDFFMMLWI